MGKEKHTKSAIIFRAPGKHFYCQPIQYPHNIWWRNTPDPSCQQKTKLFCTTKSSSQFGHMVYSFGAAPVKSQENIETIQRFQKVLRIIVNASWYIRNSDLYRDLGIKTVAHEIQRYAACKRRSFQTYSKRQPRQTTKKSKTYWSCSHQQRGLAISPNSTLYKHNLETKCSLT